MHSLCPSLQLDELCYLHYGEKKNLLSTTLIARQLTPDCSSRPQVSSDRCLAFPSMVRNARLRPT